ncbi:MAG: hypothetical protein H6719_30305 [Sandaracinaceae bacterium]|nr:hypothetical protein [Sandaracinaceae bacterium]
MSHRTRVAVWFVRGVFALALGLELLALHFPAPSGVDESRRSEVRGAWTTAGRVARALGRFVPDALDPILEPLVDDKTAHFVLFLPLGTLAAAERRLHGPLTLRIVATLTAALLIYAVIGEASQTWLGRIADPLDCVANALGGLVGIAFVAVVTRSPKRAPATPRG